MAKFKKLLEQATRDDLFSPFFIIVRFMEPNEIDYFDGHESDPNLTNTTTPPSQVEWQWEDDGDLIYNSHLFKEVYDNNTFRSKPTDTSKAKRYKLLTFAYNLQNNVAGLVPEYSAVSEEFMEPSNLEVLDSFVQDKDFLYENETNSMIVGVSEFTFSRPSDFNF